MVEESGRNWEGEEVCCLRFLKRLFLRQGLVLCP
uniref:Pco069460 n=1 Tax=Arundo donax TaxID=35708 RepID=A0A0A9E700_ARUDO